MSLAAKKDLMSNTVIIADSQKKGKGRLGRMWMSPPGRNIYMSIAFKPDCTQETQQCLPCLLQLPLCTP